MALRHSSPSIRFCACLALISFTLSLFPSRSFAQANPETLQPGKNSAALDPGAISVPGDLGEAEAVPSGKNNGTVILIRDAHSISSAQKNIKALIEYFEKNNAFRMIAAEGAEGQLDAQLLKSFPDKERLKQTLLEYQDKGELSGAAAAAISDPYHASFEGLEEWALYEEGVQDYLEAMSAQSAAVDLIEAEKIRLAGEKSKAYPEETLKADAVIDSFYSGSADMIETLKQIGAVVPPAKDSAIDALFQEIRRQDSSEAIHAVEIKEATAQIKNFLKKTQDGSKALSVFESRYQAFQISALSQRDFASYLLQTAEKNKITLNFSRVFGEEIHAHRRIEEIRGTKLFDDVNQYLDGVMDKLCADSKLRELNLETRRLRTAERFARLEISQADWTQIQSRRHDSQKDRIDALLERNEFKKHFAFYQNAERREDKMFKRILDLLGEERKSGGPASLIAVAGGFHSEGLSRRLKERGISFVLITPRIESVSDSAHYRSHMLGEISWKSYLKPEKGTLNLHSAFLRAMRDQLLKVQGASLKGQESLDPGPLSPDPFALKRWRDNLIRSLAEENRIADAGNYTKYLDELYPSGSSQDLKIKLEHFISSLRFLKESNRLNEQNVLNLFQPSAIPAPLDAAALLSPRSELRSSGGLRDLFKRFQAGQKPSQAPEDPADLLPEPGAVEFASLEFKGRDESRDYHVYLKMTGPHIVISSRLEGAERIHYEGDFSKPILLGRSSSKGANVLFPDFEGMSRVHLELKYENGVWLFKDLETTFGTKYRGIDYGGKDERGDKKANSPWVEIKPVSRKFRKLLAQAAQQIVEQAEKDPVLTIEGFLFHRKPPGLRFQIPLSLIPEIQEAILKDAPSVYALVLEIMKRPDFQEMRRKEVERRNQERESASRAQTELVAKILKEISEIAAQPPKSRQEASRMRTRLAEIRIDTYEMHSEGWEVINQRIQEVEAGIKEADAEIYRRQEDLARAAREKAENALLAEHAAMLERLKNWIITHAKDSPILFIPPAMREQALSHNMVPAGFDGYFPVLILNILEDKKITISGEESLQPRVPMRFFSVLKGLEDRLNEDFPEIDESKSSSREALPAIAAAMAFLKREYPEARSELRIASSLDHVVKAVDDKTYELREQEKSYTFTWIGEGGHSHVYRETNPADPRNVKILKVARPFPQKAAYLFGFRIDSQGWTDFFEIIEDVINALLKRLGVRVQIVKSREPNVQEIEETNQKLIDEASIYESIQARMSEAGMPEVIPHLMRHGYINDRYALILTSPQGKDFFSESREEGSSLKLEEKVRALAEYVRITRRFLDLGIVLSDQKGNNMLLNHYGENPVIVLDNDSDVLLPGLNPEDDETIRRQLIEILKRKSDQYGVALSAQEIMGILTDILHVEGMLGGTPGYAPPSSIAITWLIAHFNSFLAGNNYIRLVDAVAWPALFSLTRMAISEIFEDRGRDGEELYFDGRNVENTFVRKYFTENQRTEVKDLVNRIIDLPDDRPNPNKRLDIRAELDQLAGWLDRLADIASENSDLAMSETERQRYQTAGQSLAARSELRAVDGGIEKAKKDLGLDNRRIDFVLDDLGHRIRKIFADTDAASYSVLMKQGQVQDIAADLIWNYVFYQNEKKAEDKTYENFPGVTVIRSGQTRGEYPEALSTLMKFILSARQTPGLANAQAGEFVKLIAYYTAMKKRTKILDSQKKYFPVPDTYAAADLASGPHFAEFMRHLNPRATYYVIDRDETAFVRYFLYAAASFLNLKNLRFVNEDVRAVSFRDGSLAVVRAKNISYYVKESGSDFWKSKLDWLAEGGKFVAEMDHDMPAQHRAFIKSFNETALRLLSEGWAFEFRKSESPKGLDTLILTRPQFSGEQRNGLSEWQKFVEDYSGSETEMKSELRFQNESLESVALNIVTALRETRPLNRSELREVLRASALNFGELVKSLENAAEEINTQSANDLIPQTVFTADEGRLIDTIRRLHPDLKLGLALPESSKDAAGTSSDFVRVFLKVFKEIGGAIGSIVVKGQVGEDLASIKQDVTFRVVNKLDKRNSVEEEGTVPVAVADDSLDLARITGAFLPVSAFDLEKVSEDPRLVDHVLLMQIVAAVHLADIAKTKPDLLKQSSRKLLQAELIRRMNLLGLEKPVITFGPNGTLGISSVAVRIYIQALAARQVGVSA